MDMHTHDVSTLHSSLTSDLRVNGFRAPAIQCKYTKFVFICVYSSGHFSFRVWTHTDTQMHKVTDVNDHHTDVLAAWVITQYVL